MHLRDFAGFHETRRQILLKDPSNKDSWTAYATACYIHDDLATCISCVESILRFDAEDTKKQMNPVQRMEILTLSVRSHEGLGQYSEAIQFMNDHIKSFVDNNQREEMLGRLY